MTMLKSVCSLLRAVTEHRPLTLCSVCAAAGLMLFFALSPHSAGSPASTDNMSASDNAQSEGRWFYITVPDTVSELERPPVPFYHDRHTDTLAGEDCTLCHPARDGQVVFEYPKERDVSDRDAFMRTFHDACIACHTDRLQKDKKTGPVTCGGCHDADHEPYEHEYVPVLPPYYNPLRDTHHRDCIMCHGEDERTAHDAPALDWKSFYIKQHKQSETQWPQVLFDYYLHNTHTKALEEKCEQCHYVSPANKSALSAEKKEPDCRDWLLEVPEGRSLTEEKSAHARCINCHLSRQDEDKKAGPVFCFQCHSETIRTAEQMREVPRQPCEQEERMLIAFDNQTRMPPPAFDHRSHELNTRSCQDCHHDTLEPCSVCHTPEGAEEGDFVTLAEAYHDPDSSWSCIGCHDAEKKKSSCAGCHSLLPEGIEAAACDTCHAGTLDPLENQSKTGSAESLISGDIDDELKIDILADEYDASPFPHRKIIEKLQELSDNSSLARYFHTDAMTICMGCHHAGPVKKEHKPPLCRTCHTARTEPTHAVPALMGAYHQQCLGCHRQMGGAEENMPQTCTGCHEETDT